MPFPQSHLLLLELGLSSGDLLLREILLPITATPRTHKLLLLGSGFPLPLPLYPTLTTTQQQLPLQHPLFCLLFLSLDEFLVFAVVYHIATRSRPHSAPPRELMFVLLCAQMLQRGLHRFEVFIKAAATLGIECA